VKVEILSERRNWLFIILAGLFITNAVTAELMSNKLIQVPIEFNLFGNHFGPFATIIGILPWPIVFLLTDLMNEFYGQKAVRRLSWITAGLIAYCFIIVGISLAIPAYEIPGSDLADNASYLKVFGQSQMIIVGSICAFLVSQLLDQAPYRKSLYLVAKYGKYHYFTIIRFVHRIVRGIRASGKNEFWNVYVRCANELHLEINHCRQFNAVDLFGTLFHAPLFEQA
jgi:hypothetical protein